MQVWRAGERAQSLEGQDETRQGRMGKAAQLVFALRRGAELAEVWLGLQELWLCLPVAVRRLNLNGKENLRHLSTEEREEMI
jgi:hypothetical protein